MTTHDTDELAAKRFQRDAGTLKEESIKQAKANGFEAWLLENFPAGECKAMANQFYAGVLGMLIGHAMVDMGMGRAKTKEYLLKTVDHHYDMLVKLGASIHE
jgi:hypothetical protein